MTTKTATSEEVEEQPDWQFIWIFALILFILCAIPTGVVVAGAWLVRLIWEG